MVEPTSRKQARNANRHEQMFNVVPVFIARNFGRWEFTLPSIFILAWLDANATLIATEIQRSHQTAAAAAVLSSIFFPSLFRFMLRMATNQIQLYASHFYIYVHTYVFISLLLSLFIYLFLFSSCWCSCS